MDRSEWVLPGPMPHSEGHDAQTYAAGWNGCLNEFRRLNAAPPPPAEQARGELGVFVGQLRRIADVLRKHQFIPPASLDQIADNLTALSQRPVGDEAVQALAAGNNSVELYGPGNHGGSKRWLVAVRDNITEDADEYEGDTLAEALTAALAPQQQGTAEDSSVVGGA